MPFMKKLTIPAAAADVWASPVKDLKQHQQDAQKARQRVQEIRAQLHAAREEYQRITREAVDSDQIDASAIGAMLAEATQKVLRLEEALNIAIRQEEQANER